MNVVLAGMKHCGKSTLGAELARRWSCAFYDVDRMVEDTYACQTGRRLSVREIYRTHGPQWFVQLEGQAVRELHRRLAGREGSAVIAAGGQTLTHPVGGRLLGEVGLVVYLRVDADELLARVKRGGLPPFLDGPDPDAQFHALYRQRQPIYEEKAHLVVDLDRAGVEQALAILVGRIEEHVHGR